MRYWNKLSWAFVASNTKPSCYLSEPIYSFHQKLLSILKKKRKPLQDQH